MMTGRRRSTICRYSNPAFSNSKIGSSTFRDEQQICENFLLPKELDWRGTRHLYAGDH